MFKYFYLLLLFLIGCSDSNPLLSPVDEVEQDSTSNDTHQVFYYDLTQDDEDDNGFFHLTIDTTNCKHYIG